jgi:hypothetical protein
MVYLLIIQFKKNHDTLIYPLWSASPSPFADQVDDLKFHTYIYVCWCQRAMGKLLKSRGFMWIYMVLLNCFIWFYDVLRQKSIANQMENQ